MGAAQRAYIRSETIVSFVINAGLSALLAFVAFGGMDRIPLIGGPGALLFDGVLQSLGIAFFVTLVPSLIARKRVKNGKVSPVPEMRPSRLPNNIVLRSAVIALAAGSFGVVLHAAVLPLVSPDHWTFATALPFKILYGGLLGAAVTPIAVGAVLREPAIS